ncbi:hypothetical protein EB796_006818 [Bugula neritina]|uniref:Uncharacterized protein n=1 Tax=Bugula neritina TaxID=10212 RepID=A0A7J7KB80_BUGNE|nr:hypothetical protein EB796_006818 [Bugula neritina]
MIVNFISRYKETENVISQLMSENVSLPEVPSIATLQVKDEKREIEVEVVTSQDGQTTPNALNKQLILQHTVEVGGTPASVCSYQGKVYVASSTGLDVVVEHKLLRGKLIYPYQTSIYGVAAHRDRLYISTREPLTVILDADLEFLSDVYNFHVTGNTLIVPSREKKAISFYQIR